MLQKQEELAQRGQELYESCIRQQIEVGNDGKIVAIDIELGEFEVDETVMGATDWLFKRQPNAEPGAAGGGGCVVGVLCGVGVATPAGLYIPRWCEGERTRLG